MVMALRQSNRPRNEKSKLSKTEKGETGEEQIQGHRSRLPGCSQKMAEALEIAHTCKRTTLRVMVANSPKLVSEQMVAAVPEIMDITTSACPRRNFSLIWVSWTFLRVYSKAKLKSSGNKISRCLDYFG
jgi:hypothetical protein